MDIMKLVDQAKHTCGAKNDREFAQMLGVSNAVPSQWRTGTTIPKPEHAQKLAELAGIDAAPVVAEVLLLSTADKGLRRTLERFKRALVAAAGVIPALMVALHQCILCKKGLFVKINIQRQVELGVMV